MPERLTPAQFMLAPKEVRDYMHHMWKIPQSGGSEVVDGVQVSDGHTYQDLAIITKELLTEYIGSEESFLRAWEISVSKALTELHPPEVVIGKAPVVEVEVAKVDLSVPVDTESFKNVVGSTGMVDAPVKRVPGRPAKTN